MIDENKNVSIKIVTFKNYDKLINVEKFFVFKIEIINVFNRFNDWKIIVIIVDDESKFDIKTRHDNKNNNHCHDVISKNEIHVNWWRNVDHIARYIFRLIRKWKRLTLSFETSIIENEFFRRVWFRNVKLYCNVTKNIECRYSIKNNRNWFFLFNEEIVTTKSNRRKTSITIFFDFCW